MHSLNCFVLTKKLFSSKNSYHKIKLESQKLISERNLIQTQTLVCEKEMLSKNKIEFRETV